MAMPAMSPSMLVISSSLTTLMLTILSMPSAMLAIPLTPIKIRTSMIITTDEKPRPKRLLRFIPLNISVPSLVVG